MPDENQTTTGPVVASSPVTPLVTGDSASPAPILLTDSDVAATPKTAPVPATQPVVEATDKEQLADKVEVLTGEVEALTEKIDKLVVNVKPTVEPSTTVSAPSVPEAVTADKQPTDIDKSSLLSQKAEVAPIVSEDNTSTEKEPPKAVSETVEAPKPTVPKPELPLNDIYPAAQMPAAPVQENPYKQMPVAQVPSDHREPILGVIGEVIGAIGLTVFLLMVISPFYKGIFSASIWDAIKLIGWLTTVSSLFVGFVFSLFSPRKVTLKMLLFVGLLISLVIFLGVDGSGSIASKLNTYLGQYLNYYL